jgi:hypothetical protein
LRWPQQTLGPHHVQDENTLAVFSIENAAGRLDYLTIAPTLQLGRFGAALGVLGQLLDMLEHLMHQCPRRFGILQRNVISDGVKVA